MTERPSTIMEMESRLRALEDDKAIRELLARYGYHADQGRSAAYANLFTEDGSIDLTFGPGGNVSGLSFASAELDREIVVRHQGREQILQFISDPNGHKAIEGRCLHFMGNNLTTHIEGNEATAESYNLTLLRRGTEFVLLNAAVSRWTLRRVEGKWQIASCFRRRPGTEDFGNVLVTEDCST